MTFWLLKFVGVLLKIVMSWANCFPVLPNLVFRFNTTYTKEQDLE